MGKTLAEVATIIKGVVVGDGNVEITGITGLENPLPGHLGYIAEPKKLAEAEKTPLAALIVPPQVSSSSKPIIQHPYPKVAWAMLLSFTNPPRTYSKTISPQASISPSAKIGKEVTIEAFAVIGDNVMVGDGSVIRSGVFLDMNTNIGSNTVIHPNVMLYDHTKVGNNVIIHANTVIGSDGFGYVFDGQKHFKVPQIGNVIIEDDVEIGACVTIDRATIGSTIIHRGVKIDNLVQVAHNVEVGSHTCLSAQVGISGSSKIGNYVTMGGRAGIADHVEIGDQVMLGAQSGIPTGKKIPPKQIWIGAPARPYQEMRKQVSAQLRSYETQQLVHELTKRVAALENQISEQKLKNAQV